MTYAKKSRRKIRWSIRQSVFNDFNISAIISITALKLIITIGHQVKYTKKLIFNSTSKRFNF